jgi:long-chain acyl-CoA synthetase
LSALPWPPSRDALRLWLSDLLAAEFRRLRRGEAAIPAAPWTDDFWLDGRGLAADSIERVDLAAALYEACHAEASGVLDSARLGGQFGSWLDLAAQSFARGPQTMVFFSSGSTAAPKRLVHAVSALDAEIESLLALIGARRRVLIAVPTHHIYGFLFGIRLPEALGAQPIALHGVTPQALIARAQPGDLIVSQPRTWATLANSTVSFPRDVIGLSSTERLDEHLFAELTARGLSRLIDVYGSSETAGIGWRDTTGPYALMAHLPTVPQDAPDAIERVGTRLFTVGARRERSLKIAGVLVVLEPIERLAQSIAGVISARAGLTLDKPARIALEITLAADADETAVRAMIECDCAARFGAAAQPRQFHFSRIG